MKKSIATQETQTQVDGIGPLVPMAPPKLITQGPDRFETALTMIFNGIKGVDLSKFSEQDRGVLQEIGNKHLYTFSKSAD